MEEEKKRQLRICLANILQDCQIVQNKLATIDSKISALEEEKRMEEGKLANLWIKRNEHIAKFNIKD